MDEERFYPRLRATALLRRNDIHKWVESLSESLLREGGEMIRNRNLYGLVPEEILCDWIEENGGNRDWLYWLTYEDGRHAKR